MKGAGAKGDGQIIDQGDYTGFGASPNDRFGLIKAANKGDSVYKKAQTYTLGGKDVDSHKSIESDDFNNGAPDGEFNEEIEIDFDEFEPNFEVFNHAVDFQAVVRDIAGNVGFSDSDAANPRFINALGQDKTKDRDPRWQEAQRPRCILQARRIHRRTRPVHHEGRFGYRFLRT